jgi:hypothetical protein
MDEPGGHYVKWNKPDIGRHIQCDLTSMWSLNTSTSLKESRMVVVRVGAGVEVRVGRHWPENT